MIIPPLIIGYKEEKLKNGWGVEFWGEKESLEKEAQREREK